MLPFCTGSMGRPCTDKDGQEIIGTILELAELDDGMEPHPTFLMTALRPLSPLLSLLPILKLKSRQMCQPGTVSSLMHTVFTGVQVQAFAWMFCRVGQDQIFIRCTYGIFGMEITKGTVIYGAYIRYWPTLMFCVCVCIAQCTYIWCNRHPKQHCWKESFDTETLPQSFSKRSAPLFLNDNSLTLKFLYS